MLKSQKSQLTCSYCSKIFKDPIELPCGDFICRVHLSERDVVKQNKIKCKACNAEFGVKSNEFKSNEDLKKLIECQSHLDEEEIELKHDLEDSIRKFFEFYEEFIQNRTKLDSDVFDYFQEIRFQIDQHREELKKRIDDIALVIIDETNKCQEKYLNSLKESFSSFDDCKSLEHELNQIEETFRHPNLLVETIKEMQQKQKKSLKEIQFKLNEINQVKDDLIATTEFQPNLFSLNQEGGSSLFGSIRLEGYWLNTNPFESEILTDVKQSIELLKVCEFSPNDSWSLLYRGTRDGFGAKDFHSKCDGHSNTLTILKAKQSEFIFGGFTTAYWNSSSECGYDEDAFIFSLTNKDNKPVKMKIDPYIHHYAIDCDSSSGPSFGGDICIANNANATIDSFSNLGGYYPHPQYEYGTKEAETFLAGSKYFQLDEIEIYQIEYRRRNRY
jgi:hypothetical protein